MTEAIRQHAQKLESLNIVSTVCVNVVEVSRGGAADTSQFTASWLVPAQPRLNQTENR